MGTAMRKQFRSRFGIIVSAIFYTFVFASFCYAAFNLFSIWSAEYSPGEVVQRSVR